MTMMMIDESEMERLMDALYSCRHIDELPKEVFEKLAQIERMELEESREKNKRVVRQYEERHRMVDELSKKYTSDVVFHYLRNNPPPDKGGRRKQERLENRRMAMKARVINPDEEHKQKSEVKLRRPRHPDDLLEKKMLVQMLDDMTIFKKRIDSKRSDENNRLMRERAAKVLEIQKQKQEREIKRKMLFFLKTEQEKLQHEKRMIFDEKMLQEEESERKKMKEMKKKAKLDKIGERRRLSEIEEKVARQKVIDLWRFQSDVVEPSAAAACLLPPEQVIDPLGGSKLIIV